MDFYLGIDNGVTGALAILTKDGKPVSWVKMPLQKTRKGNEVDVNALAAWVESADITSSCCTVVIEEPGGSQSYNAATSMAGAFHAVRAFFELEGWRLIRITPPQWQKPLLKCGRGETKPVAAQMAKSLWPEFSFLPTDRCTKMDEGGVDAMLIAEWARRNSL